MFHTTVVESDAFLDMPIGAQALYFHLGMHADDDGFLNSPRQIMRKLRRPPKDLQLLIEKGFLMDMGDVMVLTHWRIANSLKSDRLRQPRFPEVAAALYLREDMAYTLEPMGESLLESRRQALESKRNPKVREGKGSKKKISKPNITQVSETGLPTLPAEQELKLMGGKLGKGVVLLNDEEMGALLDQMGLDAFDFYVEKLAKFILANNAKINNHYATILKWWQEDRGVHYDQ